MGVKLQGKASISSRRAVTLGAKWCRKQDGPGDAGKKQVSALLCFCFNVFLLTLHKNIAGYKNNLNISSSTPSDNWISKDYVSVIRPFIDVLMEKSLT